MAMKKKFLGLAMAAMIALPATTAYANPITIGGPDTQPLTQKVTVSGTVKKSDGTAPEGKIEVELPTTLSFTVDQKGGVQSADYSVKNNSSKSVVVSVQSFQDTTPNVGDGITVKSLSDINTSTDNRATVALKLIGAPVLGSPETELDLKDVNGDDILQVAKGTTGVMTLSGIAGTKEDTNGTIDTNGVTDQFNLVFNIRAED